MTKRDQQKAATRAEILEVSERLFSTQGFEKTSIQHITEACGLTKGAFYHHFESKDHILEELCRQHNKIIRDAALPHLYNKDLDWEKKLHTILAATRGAGIEKAPFIGEFFRTRDSSLSPTLLIKLKQYDREIYRELFSPILEEARDAGDFNFSGSAEVIAVFIQELDVALTSEILRIIKKAKQENAEQQIRDTLNSFADAIAGMLGTDRAYIETLLRTNESMEYFKTVLG